MQVVEQLMSRSVTSLGRNDQLSLAEDLLQASRIRHLPVLNDQGRLVGILSQRDLFHSALVRALGFGTIARDKMLQTIAVKNVMTERVLTTTPDTPPIGMFPDADYTEFVATLGRGDRVYFYSDGVTDAMNPADEDFGQTGLVETLATIRALPLDRTLRELRAAVGRWRGTNRLDDDLTLLALEIPARREEPA